ncbi:probable serine/threonine-protein kinase At1g54610 [Phragmites australis]|uniref:probable serine/threonine-protein kinase At1g54610 n=1 Tax=Phragmites australis TaxID=29695 RepID=UPI002D76C3FD|nr:probable serine/threonine-protein kinase At1g54610 [Phragmites australis]
MTASRRIGNSVKEDENGAREEDGNSGREEDDDVEEDGNDTGQEDGNDDGEEDDDVKEDIDSGHGLVGLQRRGLLGVGRRFGGRHRERKIFFKCQRAQSVELFYSGRALLNGLLGHICPKCSKKDDGTTSEGHTTACTCLQRFFAPSSSDSAAVASANGGNTAALNAQSEENGFTPSSLLDDAEKTVSAADHSRKSSVHRRLKIWISSGHNGIIGRHGIKLELGVPNVAVQLSSEHVDPGWPDWLKSVAPEAVQGWSPRRSDSFEKLGKVGQGTYSNVYKARDLETGRFVALKKLRFVNMDPESVRFMAREIRILRKLNHPNIIKLEGIIASSVSQSLYLIFEYMEHDLVGLAGTPGLKFTEPQVKCLLQQLLSGLDHCHSNGVLHRDMKSSNILIDSSGVLKIADFGLATTYDPDNQQPLTSRVATLWYRPPELLLGATKYGPSVDMWSTGCILAELLAGKPILPGRTEVEQIHRIFKLCGSPCGEYWKKLEVPQTGLFKPGRQYRGCIAETFKDFPHSALVLLDNLLALEPETRGTASSTLQSDFFRTKPLACSPSSLPKCPASKEYDVRLRREEARRQRKASQSVRGTQSVVQRNDTPTISRAGNGSIKTQKHEDTTPNINSEDEPRTLATGVQSPGFDSTWNSRRDSSDHPEVPGRKYNSVRVANFTAIRTKRSDVLQPESADARNEVPASDTGDRCKMGPMMSYRGKSRRFQYSGSMITAKGNMEQMLKEHERNIQEAVRKARLNKSREL